MHPPLGRPHPECQKQVKQLVSCHENNPFKNILVRIILQSYMDWCFRQEKHNKRAKNLAKSQKFNAKWEKVKQLREQQKENNNNQ